MHSTLKMALVGFALISMTVFSACDSTDTSTPTASPKLAEVSGALGGTLSDNRDRLFLTYAARRGYAGDPCALWTSMNSSEKGIYLTITHRLWEATVQSTGLRALTHIRDIYSIMGVGVGCGGPEDNRMFMRMGPPLKEALTLASEGKSYALTTLGNADHWRESHDFMGPHTPFDNTAETDFGGPRAQAHFWKNPLAEKPVCRSDFKSQCITDTFILEVDQDYNWKHDSSTECKYGGKTGRAIYASKHPGVDYGWEPLTCNPEQPFCGDGDCQKPTEDCGKCPTDCTCMPGVTGCWPNGQGNHACLKLPSCTTTEDCAIGECVDGACLMDCGDGYCNKPVEDCDSCKEDCGCIIEGFEACNPVTGECDPSAPICGDGICSEGVCGDCQLLECKCPPGSGCGCPEDEENCEQEVCIVACEDGPCSLIDGPCDCEPLVISVCGDGTCGASEGCGTCAVDCPCTGTQSCHVAGNGCYECGDGECTPNLEDCITCKKDCPCASAEVCVKHQCLPGPVPCGDDICHHPDEDCGVCEADCKCTGEFQCVYHECGLFGNSDGEGTSQDHCGNGYCDESHENCGSCPADCHCPGEGCVQGQCSADAEPCGDGVCAPGIEDCGTCVDDCPCPTGKTCVQHQCVAAPTSCGDGSCEPGTENCGNCPFDCDCPTGEDCVNFECTTLEACGDDTCDLALENCANCPDDCHCPDGTVCKNEQCMIGSTYCGDGQCKGGEENCGNCPGDCPCPGGTTCKNNQCVESGQNDCGDGQCKGGEENCGNCPGDCPCPGGQQCQNNQCVESGQNDCGDGQCKGGEENCGNCYADCPCPDDKTCKNNQCVDKGPQCGDGQCEGSENCGNCDADCPCANGQNCKNNQCVTEEPSCGDGTCNGTEHCDTCHVDCPCAAGEICDQGMCVEKPQA